MNFNGSFYSNCLLIPIIVLVATIKVNCLYGKKFKKSFNKPEMNLVQKHPFPRSMERCKKKKMKV